MSIHYNAFISYRHHPDDIRVASEIHRALERFHVPKSIRKKTGQIKRLFRDKEELPITSDLNDDIDIALRNSDFLIVICSVHTKESIWVQREIEFFLQTHPKNRVLTVLASGEPYDVIPEILLYNDVVDPATGETKRIMIEPLSCDWRIKRKQAMQEELPRLAAALLGCSYDELRQRQRQYRVRRNMTIVSSALAASLCLTAYFLHTSITIQKANIQIQDNLNQSLINQSRHLATAAQERLADGDRLTALALSIAALPGEGNERPYVPEAENTLIAALGLYRTSNQPTAVGTISPGTNIGITNFWVTAEENILYIYDKRQTVTVWNTETLRKIGEFSLEDQYLSKLLLLPNGNALILAGPNGNILSCWQPDGTLLWTQDRCRDMAYIPDENLILMIHLQAALNDYELFCLDASTGNPRSEAMDLNFPDSGLYPTAFIANTLPTSSIAVIRYHSDAQTVLCSLNLTTGTPVFLAAQDVYPSDALVTRDETLILMGKGESLGLAGTFGSDRVTCPESRQVSSFDLHTGEQLWETVLSNAASANHGLQEIPGSSHILCFSANVFQVLDAATGETLSRCEAGSGILTASAGEQYASAVLQDGYVCYYWYGGNYCYEVKSMANDVSHAAIGERWYAHHTGLDHVTVYTSVMGQPEWTTAIDGLASSKNRYVSGRYVALQDYSFLYLFDTESHALIWSEEKGDRELLGFSADGTKLWYAEGKAAVTGLDIASGKADSRQLPLYTSDSGVMVRGRIALFHDQLYYVVGGLDVPLLMRWDLNTDETSIIPIALEAVEDLPYWSWEPLNVSGNHLWLWGDEQVLLEVDLDSGAIHCLADQTSSRPWVAIREDGEAVAVTLAGKILLKTPGTEQTSVITLENANAGSLCFHGNTLLALCDNGTLYRLDETGQILSQTILQVSSDFAGNLFSFFLDPRSISWHFTSDNTLVLNALGMGNVIDCDTWAVRTSIADFLMYEETGNLLICRLGSSIEAYRLYDTPALLEMAAQALNGFQLTREQKVSYGID